VRLLFTAASFEEHEEAGDGEDSGGEPGEAPENFGGEAAEVAEVEGLEAVLDFGPKPGSVQVFDGGDFLVGGIDEYGAAVGTVDGSGVGGLPVKVESGVFLGGEVGVVEGVAGDGLVGEVAYPDLGKGCIGFSRKGTRTQRRG